VSTRPVGGERLRQAVAALLSEIVDGPPADAAFILNPGDRGLLASLDALSAQAASERPGGRSVAAHVDHVRHGFELMNRSARGEDPWQDANYAASWERQHVDAGEWQSLRLALAAEVRAWIGAARAPRDWDDITLTATLASLAHIAYHLGAIRQLAAAAAGPLARD
jgi:hypothetical protein